MVCAFGEGRLQSSRRQQQQRQHASRKQEPYAMAHRTAGASQQCARLPHTVLLPPKPALATPRPLASHTPAADSPHLAPAVSLQRRTAQRTRAVSAEVAPQEDAPAPSSPVLPQRAGILDAAGRVMLKSLTLPELEAYMVSIGERPRRARQLYRALYGPGYWVTDLSQVDGDFAIAFSAQFKDKMSRVANISGGLELESVSTAPDGTHKLVFSLKQGEGSAQGRVETVLIPMTSRGNRNIRYTACLSTQFCLTGRMGLQGNLSTAQVVEQLVAARRWLAQQAAQAQTDTHNTHSHQAESETQTLPHDIHISDTDEPGALGLLAESADSQSNEAEQQQHSRTAGWWRGRRNAQGRVEPFPIQNVVYMGLGEPLDNYHTTLSSIDILAEGLNLSRNKILVSTVGLADRMREFIAAKKAKLALSLHATTDQVRDWIVPVNKRYPISELLSILRENFPVGAKGDRFVVLEYVLLKGVNDTLEDAHRLVELTKDIYCMINLIVFNPHDGTPFQKTTNEQAFAFREVLVSAGRVCTLRLSKGDEEMAACGQLGDPSSVPRPVPVNPQLRDLLQGAQMLQMANAQAATAKQ